MMICIPLTRETTELEYDLVLIKEKDKGIRAINNVTEIASTNTYNSDFIQINYQDLQCNDRFETFYWEDIESGLYTLYFLESTTNTKEFLRED
jgi:hypothetical protein